MLAASEQLQVPSNITKVWFLFLSFFFLFFFYFKSCPIFCSSGPLVSTLLICYFINPTNTLDFLKMILIVHMLVYI